MENNTPKHFALQLGSLISLYLSIGFLVALLFAIIEIIFADPVDGYYMVEMRTDTVRLGIGMLVVFFPTYLILTRLVNNLRRQELHGAYLTLTKWLLYLSLLVGGAVLLGDLATVIVTFLNGEITTRFVLKALVLFIVTSIAFYYYLRDAQSYWIKNERGSIIFAAGSALVVLVSIVYGYTFIETPAEARAHDLDQKQLSDLQEIQRRIEMYHTTNSRFPETLKDLSQSSSLPTAPEGREAYAYKRTASGFDLCANFAFPSSPNDYNYLVAPFDERAIKNPDDWTYDAGGVCFERISRPTEKTVVPLQLDAVPAKQ